ncbi:MAG: hypothetical protein Kow00127_08490 [Bacteroidales bacterium]
MRRIPIKMALAGFFLFWFAGYLCGQTLPAPPEGWEQNGSVKVFSSDSLYAYLDGGASLLLEYDCQKLEVIEWNDSLSGKIKLERYLMESPENAYGIFSNYSTGKGVSYPAGWMAFHYDYYIDIWKGAEFLRLISYRNDEESMNALHHLAGEVAPAVKQPIVFPDIVLLLRQMTGTGELIKYAVGKTGLGNFYSFGHGALAGYSEVSMFREKEKMWFLFRYEDAKRCREWFSAAKGKMQMNRSYSNYQRVEDGFTIEDKNGMLLVFFPAGKYLIVSRGVEPEVVKEARSRLTATAGQN